jgi:hypothetical protein
MLENEREAEMASTHLSLLLLSSGCKLDVIGPLSLLVLDISLNGMRHPVCSEDAICMKEFECHTNLMLQTEITTFESIYERE